MRGKTAYHNGRKVQVGLEHQAREWPTPMSGSPGTDTYNAAGNSDFSRRAMELAEGMQWRTPSDISKRGGSQSPQKRQAGGHAVNLEDQAEHWPTPMANEARLGYQQRPEDKKGSQQSLWTKAVDWQDYQSSPPARQTQDGQQSSPPRRSLNPLFVEWLMGWPQDWTSPTAWTASGPAAMVWYPWLPLSRGYLSTLLSLRSVAQDSEQGSLF